MKTEGFCEKNPTRKWLIIKAMQKGENENMKNERGKARILKHISKSYLILRLQLLSSNTY